MNKQEFIRVFKKVIGAFGSEKWPKERLSLVYEQVKDLDTDWLDKKVNEMLLSWNERVDWLELAKSEKQARSNKELRKICDEPFPDGSALEQILKENGADNVIDLIRKKNK